MIMGAALGGKTDLKHRAVSEVADGAGGESVPDMLGPQKINRAWAQSVAMRAGAITVPLTHDKNAYANRLTGPIWAGWQRVTQPSVLMPPSLAL